MQQLSYRRNGPSRTQLAAVRQAMQIFVEEDAAKGISPTARGYCSACLRPRPLRGFVQQGRYQLCNACAIEYEVARSWGEEPSAGQFVRDKRFGEADRYLLPAADER